MGGGGCYFIVRADCADATHRWSHSGATLAAVASWPPIYTSDNATEKWGGGSSEGQVPIMCGNVQVRESAETAPFSLPFLPKGRHGRLITWDNFSQTN